MKKGDYPNLTRGGQGCFKNGVKWTYKDELQIL
jgi:hypothetical protein